MKCIIVSATPFEISDLDFYLQENFRKVNENFFQSNKLQVEILVTGVGMTCTSYALGKAFAENKYDLAINAGIAGAFHKNLEIGTVVNVVSDRFGDLGVEEADGSFTDVFEMELLANDNALFTKGTIENTGASEFLFLPTATALTINKVHGFPTSIDKIKTKYKVDIESMEGAAFSYACKMAGLKYLQIRSISNYVEKRNRDNWNLPLSIQNLNKVLIDLLTALAQ